MSTREKLKEDINYAPYCNCNTMGRMTKTDKGFICDPNKEDYFRRTGCGYSFEFDEEFLAELKLLGWDGAIPKREGTAEEMDVAMKNARRRTAILKGGLPG